jgi:hypothetical protein
MALLALTGYLAVMVWGSVTRWPPAVMILSLAYLWEAGMMLTWSTLRGCADLDHVVLGTACWLVGSVFLLLGVAHPPDAWKLGTVDGLVVRVAFLLLGVAVLLLGVAFLLDRWAPAGVPFLLFGVAALAEIGFMVSLLIGELAYGVADRCAEYVRIGVLASSLFAAALAAVIFRSRNRAYRGLAAIEERDSDADGIPDVYDATTPVTTGSAPPTAHSAAGTPRGWG